MGIVNLTPDSFSDGGKYLAPEDAAAQALRLVSEGADVLDLGAESTRPGHAPVSAGEELARLLPGIQAIRAVLPDIPISIDSYKPEVAEASIRAGADIINDIWGGLYLEHGRLAARLDSSPAQEAFSPMCAAAARVKAPIILMHNRTAPAAADFWDEYLADLRHLIALARGAGVPDSQLWLDPGFGFGKTPVQNLECLRQLRLTKELGFPVLLGTSRKSTLGIVLNAPVHERLDADHAAATWGISQGADMIRVHDVAGHRRTLRMADAIRAGLAWKP